MTLANVGAITQLSTPVLSKVAAVLHGGAHQLFDTQSNGIHGSHQPLSTKGKHHVLQHRLKGRKTSSKRFPTCSNAAFSGPLCFWSHQKHGDPHYSSCPVKCLHRNSRNTSPCDECIMLVDIFEKTYLKTRVPDASSCQAASALKW